MTHLLRTVTSTTVRVISRLGTSPSQHSLRTVFSSSGIGLDNFKLSREQYGSRHRPSIDSFKKRFLDSATQPEAQIFTEDLKNMILVTETDEDIQAVIAALKKYNTSRLRLTEFHFGSPIMRLLYVMNKPDLAMQLFMDEAFGDIFRDAGPALILMNKLIEDQRYDDAMKIFEFACRRGFSTASGRIYPNDVVMLAMEALYRQNTKQSLAKAKELLGKITEQNSDISARTAAMIALLAIQQGEPSFAMEVLGAVPAPNITTLRNIRAICYADMGRVEEAINIVHLLADQPPIDNDRRRVFPRVLEHIRAAVNKFNDEDLRNRFEDLSRFVSQNNRLSTVDLLDFINEPINRRSAISTNRPGLQQYPNNAKSQRTTPNSRNTAYRQSRHVVVQ